MERHRIEEIFQLSAIDVDVDYVLCTTWAKESNGSYKSLCIQMKHHDGNKNALCQFVFVDLADITKISRRHFIAHTAAISPSGDAIALNESEEAIVWNLERSCKQRQIKLNEKKIIFLQWTSSSELILATKSAIYRTSAVEDSTPQILCELHPNLFGHQLISFQSDPSQKWFALIGIQASSKSLLIGQIQLSGLNRFNKASGTDQALTADGQAALFFKTTFGENITESTVVAIAARSLHGSGKLRIIELETPNVGEKPFQERAVNVDFTKQSPGDFPAALHFQSKYGWLYVLTKCGFLYVFQASTVQLLRTTSVSSETLLVSSLHDSVGRLLCLNRRGRLFSICFDEAATE